MPVQTLIGSKLSARKGYARQTVQRSCEASGTRITPKRDGGVQRPLHGPCDNNEQLPVVTVVSIVATISRITPDLAIDNNNSNL